jgi:hypothetical protein
VRRALVVVATQARNFRREASNFRSEVLDELFEFRDFVVRITHVATLPGVS